MGAIRGTAMCGDEASQARAVPFGVGVRINHKWWHAVSAARCRRGRGERHRHRYRSRRQQLPRLGYIVVPHRCAGSRDTTVRPAPDRRRTPGRPWLVRPPALPQRRRTAGRVHLAKLVLRFRVASSIEADDVGTGVEVVGLGRRLQHRRTARRGNPGVVGIRSPPASAAAPRSAAAARWADAPRPIGGANMPGVPLDSRPGPVDVWPDAMRVSALPAAPMTPPGARTRPAGVSMNVGAEPTPPPSRSWPASGSKPPSRTGLRESSPSPGKLEGSSRSPGAKWSGASATGNGSGGSNTGA